MGCDSVHSDAEVVQFFIEQDQIEVKPIEIVSDDRC